MFFGPTYTPPTSPKLKGDESPIDIWILSRLHNAIQGIEKAFAELDFGKFTERLYMFWLYDICDVYLEACKPILFFKGELTADIEKKQRGHRATLFTIFDFGLKALHPVMPFITEELWQNIPKRSTELSPSLCVANYPVIEEIPSDENILIEFEIIQTINKAARNLCITEKIVKKGITKTFINTHSERLRDIIEKYKNIIVTLAYLQSIEVGLLQPDPPGFTAKASIESDIDPRGIDLYFL